jgi:membrane protein
MPRVQVRWHDVWLGAVVTALLFSIGKFLIGLYIGKSGVASGFGAAGSLIVIFVWVYYSAQIFLMGAEFTWVYARTFGSMRSLSEDAKAARDADLPSRTEEAPEPPPPPPVALAPRPIVPRARRAAEPVWRNLGIGLAAGMVLRYVVPRLLRRR